MLLVFFPLIWIRLISDSIYIDSNEGWDQYDWDSMCHMYLIKGFSHFFCKATSWYFHIQVIISSVNKYKYFNSFWEIGLKKREFQFADFFFYLLQNTCIQVLVPRLNDKYHNVDKIIPQVRKLRIKFTLIVKSSSKEISDACYIPVKVPVK